MKRTATLILTLLIGLIALSDANPATAADGCVVTDLELPGCLTISAWTPFVDKVNLTIYRLPRSGLYVDEKKGVWVAKFAPFCDGNKSDDHLNHNDAMCTRARNTCHALGSDAVVAMYMGLESLTDGFPQVLGPICFEASAKIDFGPQIQQRVEDEIGADPPPISLRPTDAIVNLPMIAFTDPRPPINVDIDTPVVGTATATPEFTWAFAPGAAAHGPGLPYDGTSPTLNPGYYVTYTYGSLGTPTVGLTVTWRVVFTMPGAPPVPLDDVVRTNTQTTQVRAAGSELIGG